MVMLSHGYSNLKYVNFKVQRWEALPRMIQQFPSEHVALLIPLTEDSFRGSRPWWGMGSLVAYVCAVVDGDLTSCV